MEKNMTIEEALQSGKLNKITDAVYEKYNNSLLTEIENIIDNILLEGYVDQKWFIKYKLKPYLKERFMYHMDYL